MILEWKVHGGSHSIPRETWFVARFEKCGSKKPVLKVLSSDQRHGTSGMSITCPASHLLNLKLEEGRGGTGSCVWALSVSRAF